MATRVSRIGPRPPAAVRGVMLAECATPAYFLFPDWCSELTWRRMELRKGAPMHDTGQSGQITSLEDVFGWTPESDDTREMYLILYPKELEDEIIQTLEAVHVPGYTELPKMVGRGRHIRHFDNAIWPGATGAVIVIVRPDEAEH